MLESGFQKKIITSIEDIGGVVVNGTYSKSGIADLICGWPMPVKKLTEKEKYYLVIDYGTAVLDMQPQILLHLHVEVKTKTDYNKLFKKNIKEVNGLYIVDPEFSGREVLQAHKLNDVRKRGGLALFAYSFEQVQEYVNGHV